MDGFEKWEREVYPRLWHLAYDVGVKARADGLPRVCNLEGSPHCHNGNVLKVYKSAWEQGWDGYKIPAEFAQMEATLNQMPLRKMTEEDL
jgi:hypothetical protein